MNERARRRERLSEKVRSHAQERLRERERERERDCKGVCVCVCARARLCVRARSYMCLRICLSQCAYGCVCGRTGACELPRQIRPGRRRAVPPVNMANSLLIIASSVLLPDAILPSRAMRKGAARLPPAIASDRHRNGANTRPVGPARTPIAAVGPRAASRSDLLSISRHES